MSEATPDWLSLSPGESVVWSGQPRRRSVVKFAVLFGVLSLAVVALDPLYLAASVPAAALLTVWLYLRVINTRYVLTDESVYRRTGVLGETVERAALSKIQNVSVSKGVVGQQFGFGTVEVSTAGSGGADVRIANVHDPGEVAEMLESRARQSAAAGVGGGRAAGSGIDPAEAERLREEARKLRETAESLEDTFTGGGA